MILSKMVVKVYAFLLEIALWFFIAAGAISGWAVQGVVGAIFGMVSSAVIGALVLGALLVLNDIRDRVAALELRK